MRGGRKQGCGCGNLVLLAVISMVLLGSAFWIFNRNFVISRREISMSRIVESGTIPVQTPTPVPTPQPVVEPTPTPAPTTVDLVDLQTKMQDWPEVVTLQSAAVFPGEVTAPSGTEVKLISAGPEVEVEYQGGQAKLLADQTDVVARVLAHRAQIAREMEIERKLSALAASRLRSATDASARQFEQVYGRMPGRDDAYFAIKTYLKQIQKDPDSVQMGSVSQLFPGEFGGHKCWGAKVTFRLRDAMGYFQSESGIAYVDGDRAIGYEKSQ